MGEYIDIFSGLLLSNDVALLNYSKLYSVPLLNFFFKHFDFFCLHTVCKLETQTKLIADK